MLLSMKKKNIKNLLPPVLLKLIIMRLTLLLSGKTRVSAWLLLAPKTLRMIITKYKES